MHLCDYFQLNVKIWELIFSASGENANSSLAAVRFFISCTFSSKYENEV